jgi:hypothetical protein
MVQLLEVAMVRQGLGLIWVVVLCEREMECRWGTSVVHLPLKN